MSLSRDATAAGKPTTQVSLTSPSLLQCTICPSAILAAKQLKLMLTDAARSTGGAGAAGSDPLLQGLAARAELGESSAAAAPTVASAAPQGGGGCWLMNKTGVPLSYLVADASLSPAVAAAQLAAGCGGGIASGRRAAPLRVRDPIAAGFRGRWVDYPDAPACPGGAGGAAPCSGDGGDSGAGGGGCGGADGRESGGAGGGQAAAGGSVLYLQVSGQKGVFGPVALRQRGTSLHTLRDGGGSGGTRCVDHT